jgi:hypothetical protein
LRLLGRRVWNDDAAFGLVFLLESLDDNTIVERTNFMVFLLRCLGSR